MLLNEFQKKAVESAPERPLLIVAGAGTGKTKTLTSRIAQFIKNGVPADKILAVTFTNKAAKEMSDRVESNLKAEGSFKLSGKPLIGTFHSIGARMLRSNARLTGRTPDFVIYDDNDSFALIKKILKDLDRKKDKPAAHASMISAVKNGGESQATLKAAQREVFEKYEMALEAANAFDFDDLLVKTVMVLKSNSRALARYRDRFSHILVDEYQDINAIQHEFINLLTHPNEASGGKPASISVVGDAEQTIYGWRGSDIEIFLRFPEEWSNAEMVTLNQNYRSTKNILRAASGVIEKNVYHTKVKRATDLWTENPEGEKVVVRECYSEDDEAWWIAEKISSFPFTISKENSRDANQKESTAILYRTNAQSRALEQALLAHRIPYVVYGGLRFYERREIKDIVAGLRLALNPRDEMSRERLEKAFSKRAVRALEEAFATQGEAPPVERVDQFLRTMDYFSYIDRYLTNPEDRRENIEELVHFAAKFAALPPLLEEIALLQTTDDFAKRAARGESSASSTHYALRTTTSPVVLMTIHLAKGLEFDRIFVAGVTEGVLPHERSMMNEEGIQEERRLMYVAMTRAREELYLSFSVLPSRFLSEIPEDAIRFETSEGKSAEPDFRDEEYEERYISLD